jgi:CBS domain containing-hemolysin-like protein
VNGFEEIVGILTIEDVLEEIIGKEVVDEFDQYEDLRAVAALQAKKDTKLRTHAPESPETKHREEDNTPKS